MKTVFPLIKGNTVFAQNLFSRNYASIMTGVKGWWNSALMEMERRTLIGIILPSANYWLRFWREKLYSNNIVASVSEPLPDKIGMPLI